MMHPEHDDQTVERQVPQRQCPCHERGLIPAKVLGPHVSLLRLDPGAKGQEGHVGRDLFRLDGLSPIDEGQL